METGWQAAADFLSLANQAGSPRAVNVALMGRFSKYLPEIPPQRWREAIHSIMPQRFVELNLRAFELGRGA